MLDKKQVLSEAVSAAAVEVFSAADSVVVFAADELVLEPQPARQPIAKAAQAMADNIFLIPFFIHFLLVRNF